MVEIAQAAVRDAGGNVPQACTGVHQVFRKYHLTVPIKPETLNVGPGELSTLPFVPFSDWVRWLLDERLASEQLCGVPEAEMSATLREFWRRYQQIHPENAMFKQEGLDLAKTVPVFSHIDEGRTYKRAGICILSVHGALGTGTKSYQRRLKVRKVSLKKSGMGMNYMRNTWTTQFMCCSLIKSAYAKDPRVSDNVLLRFASDMAHLAKHGDS